MKQIAGLVALMNVKKKHVLFNLNKAGNLSKNRLPAFFISINVTNNEKYYEEIINHSVIIFISIMR